ncbi:hypothetical protein N9948_01680 [bacterium]|nr:hypothetical protein [bacterium]
MFSKLEKIWVITIASGIVTVVTTMSLMNMINVEASEPMEEKITCGSVVHTGFRNWSINDFGTSIAYSGGEYFKYSIASLCVYSKTKIQK